MRFDLKTPCKNCPFRNDETAIRFACKERAIEIEESAYRNGFPCHLSAVDTSDDDPENGGYVFGENTQHCAGAIIMYIKGDNYAWPGVDNDEELVDRLEQQMDMSAPVWEGEQEFLDSYGSDDE